MRFFKVHPAFQILFVLSVITLVAGFFLAISSSDACVSRAGSSEPKATCGVDAAARANGGLAAAIAGLAFVIGGVGFQIGRAGPAGSQQGMFAPGAPPVPHPQQFPPHGGMPQPQAAPPQQKPGQPGRRT
jgi:hypothetical protein